MLLDNRKKSLIITIFMDCKRCHVWLYIRNGLERVYAQANMFSLCLRKNSCKIMY